MEYISRKGEGFMSKKEEEKNSLKRPSMDRTGLRSFSGNPEEFELSFYGIFMACIPIFILGGIVWYNW